MGLISRVSSRTYRFLNAPVKMTKGTTSFGKRHNKTHTLCRTTGRSNYHIQKKRSANSTGPPRLSDDVPQAPADLDTSRKSRPDLPTVSDTQNLNKLMNTEMFMICSKIKIV